MSLRWPPIIEEAARIVNSYETGVTLRQLFYRLVAAELLPNTKYHYKRLSELTAKARRDENFPDLIDLMRYIHRPTTYDSPADALNALATEYRRDRTETQEVALYLGVEKAALISLLEDWFEEEGLPVLPLGGYTSQTFAKDVIRDVKRQRVIRDVKRQRRPAVLIYAGDFDPSGEDIDRDFVARTGCWKEVVRVGLSAEQVITYNLPPQVGKTDDSRASAFIERHGQLVQVELDALPPDTLRTLYTEAIARFWDTSSFDAVVADEEEERDTLVEIARQVAQL